MPSINKMDELRELSLAQLAEKIAKNRMMFCTVAITEAERVYLNRQYVQIITEFDRREFIYDETMALIRE